MFRFPAAMAFACGALLQSCATPVVPPGPPLAGTTWHVAAVNGQATPAQGDYSMRFAANGGFGARFGCNSMGGNYAVVHSTVTVTDLNQTLMGCPEPSATFERQGAAVLGQPMLVTYPGSDRIALSNPAGSITLDRLG